MAIENTEYRFGLCNYTGYKWRYKLFTTFNFDPASPAPLSLNCHIGSMSITDGSGVSAIEADPTEGLTNRLKFASGGSNWGVDTMIVSDDSYEILDGHALIVQVRMESTGQMAMGLTDTISRVLYGLALSDSNEFTLSPYREVGSHSESVDYELVISRTSSRFIAAVKGGSYIDWEILDVMSIPSGYENTELYVIVYDYNSRVVIDNIRLVRLPGGWDNGQIISAQDLSPIHVYSPFGANTGNLYKATSDGYFTTVWSTDPAGDNVGVFCCLGSKYNTWNYLLAYIDGDNIKLDKCVNTVVTNLITEDLFFIDTARLMIYKNNTTVKLLYNDYQIGADQTVSDASIINNPWSGWYTSNAAIFPDYYEAWPLNCDIPYCL